MADKVKIELEYIMRTSIKILYGALSTPSGLSGWFCDDVNIRGSQYTFVWSDGEQLAELISKKENDFIRFRWLDEPEDTFFEFEVKKDGITSDILLYIRDYVDSDEEEETRMLWDSQINGLKHMIGSS